MGMYRAIAGLAKSNGEEYDPVFVHRCWDSLEHLNENPRLQEQILAREPDPKLSRQLRFKPVSTMTGRIRGGVSYSQWRNTQFQGLAADGAKLALWELFRRGYRCIAFIHDEVLIELPVDCDHGEEARKIDQIMCGAMESLTGTVPIQCEYALMDRWSKDAEALYDVDGNLICWSPSS